MAAVLRVDLCETEDFRVGQRTAKLLLYLVQILNLLGRERQTLLLVVFFYVLHALDRFRLVVYCEDVLVEALVHALQHRVVLCIFRAYGEVLLNT